MKTLESEINEKKKLVLRKIKHKAILMNKGKCTFETFYETMEEHKNEFEEYVRAFCDAELLTNEECENIIGEFKHALVNLKSEI